MGSNHAARRTSRGAGLLEAVLALAILGIVGVTALSSVAAGIRSERRLADTEELFRAAEGILKHHVLLPRPALDIRLGDRLVDGLPVTVQRPAPSLYRIAVRDPLLLDRELLVTLVFRPTNE